MNVWHGESDDASEGRQDPLPLLIADAEPAVLGRAVLAVAAMHEPDAEGRCRVCEANRRFRPWRRSRSATACPTRRMLWVALAGEESVTRTEHALGTA